MLTPPHRLPKTTHMMLSPNHRRPHRSKSCRTLLYERCARSVVSLSDDASSGLINWQTHTLSVIMVLTTEGFGVPYHTAPHIASEDPRTLDPAQHTDSGPSNSHKVRMPCLTRRLRRRRKITGCPYSSVIVSCVLGLVWVPTIAPGAEKVQWLLFMHLSRMS